MKTFLAAFLGFLAAGVLLLAAVLFLGGSGTWQQRFVPYFEGLHRGTRVADTYPRAGAARLQAQRRRAASQDAEIQAQRRERIALLAATLRTRPATRLAAAEASLFQEAERDQARRLHSDSLITLVEPVQVDEWTVLPAGRAVEFVRAERDNLITIRYEGAMYAVHPGQTELCSRGRGD